MTSFRAPAIQFHDLSKKYHLYQSPGERLIEAFHPFQRKYHREFWALKNVQFQVLEGQTFGIIGRNGGGKSTLLQILAGVLKPTSGEVCVRGKIASLLDLGAGFHPEFTGRDNVMMRGLLTGFSKTQMKALLPQIQAFADIGEFFDQPIKIYSSGMFVRLAFAAAIHVDPDILVIDEALGVGDARFQHKCYQKLADFQKAGKTIVLVSHDMNVILNHCQKALLLEQGSILAEGRPAEVVNSYYELLFTGSVQSVTAQREARALEERELPHRSLDHFLEEVPASDLCPERRNYNPYEYRYGDKRVELIDYLVISHGEADPISIRSGDWADIYVKAKVHDGVDSPMFGFSIKTVDGIIVYGTNSRYNQTCLRPIKKSETVVFKFSIKMDLAPGHFFIDLGIAEKSADKDVPLDIRASLIHLVIEQKNRFDGFAELSSHAEEIPSARPA